MIQLNGVTTFKVNLVSLLDIFDIISDLLV